ncbi:MAG: hypothetical protein ACT6S0_15205 [Roseateles sp.]|uniref:hypothetical protein n=1 Tax=Roseateles sp. TaxID=1971397 RepID=UPI004036BBA7
MSRVLSITILLAASFASHAAGAQGLVEDVKACRQLADLARRVACYDAMKLPNDQTPSAAAPAAPVAVDSAAKFGQESVRSPAGTPALKRIESRILGKFAGWRPNQRLALENGQVWRVADDSEALYELQDPKVIVHRGLLGAFYLEIEGVPFQVRVVRAR